jgi:uncharacterized membrane protein YgcG
MSFLPSCEKLRLAVKGYLTIEQQDDNPQIGVLKDYVFHLKKTPDDWNNLKPHERQMLRGIFVPENPALMLLDRLQEVGKNLPPSIALLTRTKAMSIAEPSPAIPKEYAEAFHAISEAEKVPLPNVALSELQNRFSVHIPIIRNFIFNTLKRNGYYLRRPDTFRRSIVAGGLLTGFLMLLFGPPMAATMGMAPMPWVVAAILTAIVISGFGWIMNARTIAGARTFAKVLGFEDFLGHVERDQIERVEKTPELFEKYLPYAMALHIEKKWVQAFAGIAMQPPQWYRGSYGSSFQPSLLVDDLSAMSNRAESVMTSSPRSSSDRSGGSSSSGATGGSGFSDSGSSGGGFGGGGGGGF